MFVRGSAEVSSVGVQHALNDFFADGGLAALMTCLDHMQLGILI